MSRFKQGHHIFDCLFTPSEMRFVLTKLESMELDRTKAGARHILSAPVVHVLADDLRMLEIARGFLGSTAVPFRATLFDKSPSAFGVPWLVNCEKAVVENVA